MTEITTDHITGIGSSSVQTSTVSGSSGEGSTSAYMEAGAGISRPKNKEKKKSPEKTTPSAVPVPESVEFGGIRWLEESVGGVIMRDQQPRGSSWRLHLATGQPVYIVNTKDWQDLCTKFSTWTSFNTAVLFKDPNIGPLLALQGVASE